MRGFGIANFRSFDQEGVFLDDLGKINVIIGKNNSGKSNVLRFLRALAAESNVAIQFNAVRDHHRRGEQPPEISVHWPTDEIVPADNDYFHGVARAQQVEFIGIRFPTGRQGGAMHIIGIDRFPVSHLAILWRALSGGRDNLPSNGATQLQDEIATKLANRGRGELEAMAGRLLYVPDFRRISAAAPAGDAKTSTNCPVRTSSPCFTACSIRPKEATRRRSGSMKLRQCWGSS